MTSTTNASADSPQSRERETSSSSPADRNATSSNFSAARNRYSHASSETGESSTIASQRNSLLDDGQIDGGTYGSLSAETAGKDGRGSWRSHRSRTSGGFLLSTSTFEPPITRSPSAAKDSPPRQRAASDSKGKAAERIPARRHQKRKSNIGFGLTSSPLAGNVTTAPQQDTVPSGRSERDGTKNIPEEGDSTGETRPATSALDVDSAQIVNLALNLSESRRNASRRNVSTPLPTPATGFAENLAGGSMRYHMQQQRRSSRNISPKPDRGQMAGSGLPRVASGRLSSPLQSNFDVQQEAGYQYHFSSSTLARAEKAKKAIELMSHYRELLQYVPPLKPQTLERSSTTNTMPVPGSPTPTYSRSPYQTNSGDEQRALGRQYNPLQYIRNRKVRARTSKAIDGEAQGFDDVEHVSTWVGEVSKVAASDYFQIADYITLPPFTKAGDPSAGPSSSPQSTHGRNNVTAKIKRPRIDWMTNPADMIADVYWLEQDDNKRLIEDRHGRRIFPRNMELKRPQSRKGEEPDHIDNRPHTPVTKKEDDLTHMVDTKLPEFKSIKQDTEKFPEVGTSKARQKLRNVRAAARLHHGHSSTGHDVRQFLRSRSKSDASSSESEFDRGTARKRSGTADRHDRGKDILEKQMAERLAEESEKVDVRQGGEQPVIKSIEPQNPPSKDESDRPRKWSVSHSRSASLAHRKRDSLMNGSSGRASLEVPGTNGRNSLEELDTTAPNSPEWRARMAKDSHVPSISMDLSSPRSRHASPRRAISKVRAKMRPGHDRNRLSDRGKTTDDDMAVVGQMDLKERSHDSPETSEKRRRSGSPRKKPIHSKTDDGAKLPKKTDSLRRGKTDDSSGIRGFLKSARNPVVRVSDLLWKKDVPGHGNSPSVSSDDSDSDARGSHNKGEKTSSRDSSHAGKFDDLDVAYPRKDQPSYLKNMPVFTSPFERRGRTTESRNDQNADSVSELQAAREKRRQASRAHLFDPTPRIDVHSPASSPEFERAPGQVRRGSSLSDLDSRRGSFASGVQRADSRLNAALGIPGARRNGLPVTGLASLRTTADRRASTDGKRHWSISDREIAVRRVPATKRDIARVRALLLSSGIKAKEISRRAAETKDLTQEENSVYAEIASLSQEKPSPIPKSQQHILAARILSNSIQYSTRAWQESADIFCNTSITDLLTSIESLQSRLVNTLTPMTRSAADEADEVSKDLVTSQTLKVKHISDKMDKMMRVRRRRFRWLRRGGWVLVEWALVGVMWYVWFIVVLLRATTGLGRGVVGIFRWLLFL